MYLLENAELTSVAEESSVAGWVASFPKSGVENLADNASFGERLGYALKYAAIGLATVFLVLIIIMAVLYLFKLVSVITSKKKSGTVAAPAKAPAAANAVAGGGEEEIVAVATAAIAAARGESDCAFNVISINKIQ